MLKEGDVLALYMEGSLHDISGKMGSGVLRYSPHPVACVIDSEFPGKDARAELGIPGAPCRVVESVDAAHSLGANVFVLGIAPLGGVIPPDWYRAIDRAVELGMSVVNGLHDHLASRYPNLAAGQRIWDIRREPEGLKNGSGAAAHLGNRRVLMIGTDMAIGKMTAGLEIFSAAKRAGVNAGFVATGQIGMTIMGSGVPLDAIRLDFASGAIEREVVAMADRDLVIIEGQGSLIHPASSATLPLIRGACPTDFVLCHRARQTHLYRVPEIAIPDLTAFAKLYQDVAEACGTFPRPEIRAVALNTFGLDPAEAAAECAMVTSETGWPCWDPVRDGADEFIPAILG